MESNTNLSCINAVFQLDNIEIITVDSELKPYFVSVYTLLFVKQGKGIIIVDGRSVTLEENKCFLFQPGMLIETCSETGSSQDAIECYQVNFHPVNGSSSDEIKYLQGELFNANPAILLDKMEDLYTIHHERSTKDILTQIQKQMKFYELLYIIVKESKKSEDQKSTNKKINETIEYIKEHYNEEMTRETLAAIAGLSPGYYSHAFKKEVGKSPIDFLNEIRMNKAKELLVTSGQRLRGIANSVGFSDEFYFSRMFKKTVGISPTVYIRKNRTKIANFECTFNGHFRALNSTPYASFGFTQDNHYQLQFRKKQYTFSSKGGMVQALEALTEQKPDLIICSDTDREKEELLRKIAPTIVIPWMENDWREHFLQVADILGKSKEAISWLDRYDYKANKASYKVKERISTVESVMIVRIYEGNLSIYGTRNIGTIIYNDLKLKPVDIVTKIPCEKNQFQITCPECLQYQPDHLLLMVERDFQSQNLLKTLMSSEKWFDIPAVKKNQVHNISRQWLEYSAAAHEILIDQAVELFIECR